MHKIIWNRQPRGVRAGLRAVLLAMAGVNAGTIVARSRRAALHVSFRQFPYLGPPAHEKDTPDASFRLHVLFSL